MAEEKKETQMLDPIAYRSDYKPEDIMPEYRDDPNLPWVWPQNANENFHEYGDDSNQQWQSQRWGMNPKYEWEWVANSIIAYDPNIKTADLDPNYLFWNAAKTSNSKEANYLAKRNDMIASALYNEWKISREDVASYLAQQNWWFDSTEADRLNTIESIYKRLWQIKPQEETPKEEPDLSKAEEIATDTSWKIYGKTTAEEWNPSRWINTLADANSVFKSMEEWRIANLKALVSMDPEKIWYMIADGLSPFSDQTMRDCQTQYPEFYAEIQNSVKKIKWQQNVDSISLSWKMDVTDQLIASENNVTTSMNTFVNQTATWSGAWTLATNLNNALSESEIVSWAREQMEVYKRKIADIQQSIDELPSLANQYFKWDVPEYLVNAFINNRMQKYNKEIEKYQNLYNASLDEAKLEISQEQFKQEMNYKWASLQADQNYKNANLALSQQELAYKMANSSISNWKWNDDWSYSYVDLDGNMHTLSAEEAKKVINQDLYDKSTAYIEYWKKAIEDAKAAWMELYWWQCEAMTDNYARQNFWTEMRKEDWSAWATTVDEKARYATEALPQRWYVAIFDFWIKDANWTNWGHTGIVIDYDPVTWDFTTLESNVDWEEHITIRTRNINSSNLLWFWDPTNGEPWNWNGNWSTAVDTYMNLPNGMLDVFIDAEKSWATWEERKYVKQWREWYWILNMMLNNWEIDYILNWDEVASAVEKFTKYLTLNALNRAVVDEDWNFVLDTVLQAMANDWEILSSDERNAFRHLYRLVQIKLRRDSWAAINIWEWMWDFNMYLPQIWMSKQQKMQGLFDLERAALQSVMPWDYVKKYVPLITEEMVNAQSDKTVRNETKDMFHNG